MPIYRCVRTYDHLFVEISVNFTLFVLSNGIDVRGNQKNTSFVTV